MEFSKIQKRHILWYYCKYHNSVDFDIFDNCHNDTGNDTVVGNTLLHVSDIGIYDQKLAKKHIKVNKTSNAYISATEGAREFVFSAIESR
jgi:hypothetical protein